MNVMQIGLKLALLPYRITHRLDHKIGRRESIFHKGDGNWHCNSRFVTGLLLMGLKKKDIHPSGKRIPCLPQIIQDLL